MPAWIDARSIALTGCLVATLLTVAAAERREAETLALPLESIGEEIAGWKMTETQRLPPSVLEKLRPTAYLSRTYRNNQNRELTLFISYYAQQRAGETMHSPKACLPGSGWEIVRQGEASIAFGERTVDVNHYDVQYNGARYLAIYWYQSPEYIAANEYLGKLLLIKDAILRGHTSASIVRIMLPAGPEASTDSLGFARELIPRVGRCFGNETSNWK
jgi:EpsI family protein